MELKHCGTAILTPCASWERSRKDEARCENQIALHRSENMTFFQSFNEQKTTSKFITILIFKNVLAKDGPLQHVIEPKHN